jgi:hypothetical protein
VTGGGGLVALADRVMENLFESPGAGLLDDVPENAPAYRQAATELFTPEVRQRMRARFLTGLRAGLRSLSATKSSLEGFVVGLPAERRRQALVSLRARILLMLGRTEAESWTRANPEFRPVKPVPLAPPDKPLPPNKQMPPNKPMPQPPPDE